MWRKRSVSPRVSWEAIKFDRKQTVSRGFIFPRKSIKVPESEASSIFLFGVLGRQLVFGRGIPFSHGVRSRQVRWPLAR